jgi:hypothetical protein
MPKQRLEGHFREIISNNKDYYYIKLQVNPLAHTTSPADFFIQTKSFNYMVECKECSGKSFAFDRLTQLNDLLKFQKFNIMKNASYILLSFWKGTKKKSSYYLIDINEMISLMQTINKKSCNEKDLDMIFNKIDINNVIDYLI